MTGQYTFVDPERQNELTLRIQRKLLGNFAEAPTDGEPKTATMALLQTVRADLIR
jgi:hypothetical protein